MTTAPRRYADETEVPIERSRNEISELLRQWDCVSISWAVSALGFTWRHEDKSYAVRFVLRPPTEAQLRKEGEEIWPHFRSHGTQRNSIEAYVARGLKQGPRSIHRLLLLKLKADLNAARAGLAKAEEIFLPWILDSQGRTMGELFIPQMGKFAALPPVGGTGG